jgi:hypothetical protein
MSCLSSRASHALCKSEQCQTTCCQSNSAFSCQMLKCKELLDNVVLSDAFNEYCDLFTILKDGNINLLFFNTITQIIANIGANIDTITPLGDSIPKKHCKLSFQVINVTENCTSHVFVIENKIILSGSINPGCVYTTGDTLIFLINKKECFNFTF